MQALSSVLKRLLIVLILIGIVWAVASNYSYLFSKVVRGEVLGVERVTDPSIIAGRNIQPNALYSFAVMVRNGESEIYSASTEDRQWAVVKKGFCVEARFYPYPPWDLEAGNTYFNARLLKVYDCAPGLPKAGEAPTANSAAGPKVDAGATPIALPPVEPGAATSAPTPAN